MSVLKIFPKILFLTQSCLLNVNQAGGISLSADRQGTRNVEHAIFSEGSMTDDTVIDLAESTVSEPVSIENASLRCWVRLFIGFRLVHEEDFLCNNDDRYEC